MATKIQRRSMPRRIKFGHIYQTYNVDLCHTEANMSTSMNIQMWIHARTHTNIPSQPWESNERFNRYLGSSSRLQQSLIISM